jgi:hypothetical protein
MIVRKQLVRFVHIRSTPRPLDCLHYIKSIGSVIQVLRNAHQITAIFDSGLAGNSERRRHAFRMSWRTADLPAFHPSSLKKRFINPLQSNPSGSAGLLFLTMVTGAHK